MYGCAICMVICVAECMATCMTECRFIPIHSAIHIAIHSAIHIAIHVAIHSTLPRMKKGKYCLLWQIPKSPDVREITNNMCVFLSINLLLYLSRWQYLEYLDLKKTNCLKLWKKVPIFKSLLEYNKKWNFFSFNFTFELYDFYIFK